MITNLTAGEHGFHVHTIGNLSMNCSAAGGHFNPTNMDHGAPNATVRHVGDLGNIVAMNNSIAVVNITDMQISLRGNNSIVGRAIVVHANRDDLGLGNNTESRITGNAGPRYGCGIITLTDDFERPLSSNTKTVRNYTIFTQARTMLKEILLIYALIYFSSGCGPGAGRDRTFRATARAIMFRAANGSANPTVRIGRVLFTQIGNQVTLTGRVRGLTQGLHGFHLTGQVRGLTQGLHGFHVHRRGDLTNNCLGSGPHFNPNMQNHGGPASAMRHVGDLGNIIAGPNGVARINIQDSQITLRTGARNSIVGRALVVHVLPDDLGLGGDNGSLTTGNAGPRFGCGIITLT
ncbi:unnamed protein product [Strongylus vulgaris]|uniref:Superoxide dismutase [Cu-Zn] n=1 Tax=Strongylus vulgaris TaxID=40348 RepID=A0A3P7L0C0_STRVU|nr:unnamed protein product [Strongylus vulgaris]